MTYSDGLFTAGAVPFLLLLMRERYRWLVLVVPVMALTRGVLLPLAVVTGVHLWRRRVTLRAGSRRLVAVLAVAGVAAGKCAVAAVRIGRLNACLLVQESWQGGT